MRKQFLWLFLAANVCIFLAVASVLGGLLYLAETYPFQAGDRLYGVQRAAETWRLALARDTEKRADFALSLAERRVTDLARVSTPDAIAIASSDLSLALDEAVRSVAAAPAGVRDAAAVRLERVMVQATGVVAALREEAQYPSVTVLANKLAGIQSAATIDEKLAQVPAQPANTLLESVAIPFLGQTVDHSFYPLDGGHADLECASCHEDGTYAGTLAGCSDCHVAEPMGVAAAVLEGEHPLFSTPIYATHFVGECTDCHTTASWQPEDFDHAGVVECLTCHVEDLPGDEHYLAASKIPTRLASLTQSSTLSQPEALYPERCINCHPDTEDWLAVDFDHEGFDDCVTCHHEDSVPEDHYEGDCASCHVSTEDWNDVDFDHTSYTACADCHTVAAPHYPGACADCHTTASWTDVTFNHSTEVSCVTCHADAKPEDHYAGECATCHGVDDWTVVAMDHTGLTDCASCHEKADHYAGQCSNCHMSTEAWHVLNFNHSGYSQCSSCHAGEAPAAHYDGQCSTCHNTSKWDEAVNHNELADCGRCHVTPGVHYGENCQECHTTASWSEHTVLPDCGACHEAPATHTYSVACAECHTVGHPDPSWNLVGYAHDEFVDCGSCHIAPAGHYPGQCSNCHSDSWTTASYTHTANALCAPCHATPSGHWPGECSDCHVSTSTWLDIVFDHTTYTNCKSCHPHPSGHPRGQCSNCHTTDSWKPNHTADLLDCQSCHAEDVGDPLCIGQCTNCHTSTDTWTEVTFNHAGLPDCQSCHTADAPVDHYIGQCSNCHLSTETWLEIDFDHTGYTVCGDCHEAPDDKDHNGSTGTCTSCHNSTEAWTIDHSVMTVSCVSCHTAPAGHYPGPCDQCHSTDTWLGAVAPEVEENEVDGVELPSRDDTAPTPELPTREEPTPAPTPEPTPLPLPER